MIHISGQVTEPPEEQTRDATHEDGRVIYVSQYVTDINMGKQFFDFCLEIYTHAYQYISLTLGLYEPYLASTQ